MFLIIPVIEISNGKVVWSVKSAEGVLYPSDPAQLARVWRRENAKVLHLTDVDSLQTGGLENIDTIRNVVRTVDIPIEVSGDIFSYGQCEKLFAAGVYRVVINAAMTDPNDIVRMVDDFLPQRIVAGFTAKDNNVLNLSGKPTGINPLELGMRLKESGIVRIVYRTIERNGERYVLDLDGLKNFAVQTKLRVTAGGAIQNVQELWALQALEPFGVDSVIMSKALYENKFPCQELWRRVEANDMRVPQ